VMDMGEPVKIVDLVRDMIRLSELSENEIRIVYTGLRPGEKLHEELVGTSEKLLNTNHPKIFLTQGRPIVTRSELEAKIHELANVPPRNREAIAARLHALARIDLRDTGDTTPDVPAPVDELRRGSES